MKLCCGMRIMEEGTWITEEGTWTMEEGTWITETETSSMAGQTLLEAYLVVSLEMQLIGWLLIAYRMHPMVS